MNFIFYINIYIIFFIYIDFSWESKKIIAKYTFISILFYFLYIGSVTVIYMMFGDRLTQIELYLVQGGSRGVNPAAQGRTNK